jgi:hypothetical protein
MSDAPPPAGGVGSAAVDATRDGRARVAADVAPGPADLGVEDLAGLHVQRAGEDGAGAAGAGKDGAGAAGIGPRAPAVRPGERELELRHAGRDGERVLAGGGEVDVGRDGERVLAGGGEVDVGRNGERMLAGGGEVDVGRRGVRRGRREPEQHGRGRAENECPAWRCRLLVVWEAEDRRPGLGRTWDIWSNLGEQASAIRRPAGFGRAACADRELCHGIRRSRRRPAPTPGRPQAARPPASRAGGDDARR